MKDMCDAESNIKLSWLLVSQFVSWDFCRYMSEKSENRTLEPDVLTFLRNMVVERTEKAAGDVTKHEIIARFLMEVRTIKTLTRMPLIHKLSKNVIEKCPELETCITELLSKLEWLLETLEEDRFPGMKEEILSRISCEVNKFNNEACKKLPLPKLLQVIQTWLQLQFQAQLLEVKLKNIENIELYQKVIDCLHKEKITTEEAKTIARTLYEDKKLKKLILSLDAETEADSQSQGQSTSSFQVLQQDFYPDESLKLSSQIELPNSMPEINLANVTQAFTFEPDYSPPVPNNQKQKVSSLDESSFNPSSPEEAIEPVEQQQNTGAQDLNSLNPTASNSFKPSCSQLKVQKEASHGPVSSFNPNCSSDSDSSDITPATGVYKKKNRWKKFLKQLNCEEVFSDEEDYVSKSGKHNEPDPELNEEVLENEPMVNIFVNNDDSDTSDCDKNTEIRFLTPTMFKSDYVGQNPVPQVTMLSDYESHSSSITTNPTNSQDTDPLFIPRHEKVVSTKPSKKRSQSVSKNPQQTKLQKTSVKNDRDPVNPRLMTLRRFGFSADNARNQNPSDQNKGSVKKKFKLFNNEKSGASSSNESSLFQKNTRNPTHNHGSRRRCEECQETFKTVNEFRKHVFIEHTVIDLSDD